MKHFCILLFITSLFFHTGVAQNVNSVRLYAYQQKVLPGKKSSTVKAKETYHLYLSHSSRQIVTITGLWIKTNYYQFSTSVISKKPVVYNSGSSKDTLVPFTKNRIIEIRKMKLREPAPRPGKELGKLLAENEIVVSFMLHGKEYFTVAKTCIILESLPLY
jgi:hypothetical protein